MSFETLHITDRAGVRTIRFDRPDAKNAINSQMVSDMNNALTGLPDDIVVVVLEGDEEHFCFGADFDSFRGSTELSTEHRPEVLFDLWARLSQGPFLSIAHVRGKTNAGGLGFVAACDVAIARADATFSLSEMLFGLLPACVLPFLINRVGPQRAHYMTMTSRTISAACAERWGLIDLETENSASAVRSHVLGGRRLSAAAITRHKRYLNGLVGPIDAYKGRAVEANMDAFSDPANIRNIRRFVEDGTFPWEDA